MYLLLFSLFFVCYLCCLVNKVVFVRNWCMIVWLYIGYCETMFRQLCSHFCRTKFARAEEIFITGNFIITDFKVTIFFNVKCLKNGNYYKTIGLLTTDSQFFFFFNYYCYYHTNGEIKIYIKSYNNLSRLPARFQGQAIMRRWIAYFNHFVLILYIFIFIHQWMVERMQSNIKTMQ